MKNNENELSVDIEIVVEEVSFDRFAETLLDLDPAFPEIYKDPKTREEYSKLPIVSRLTFHSNDFNAALTELFESMNGHLKSTHRLAISVYNFCLVTGAKYDVISSKLHGAYKRSLNKSYIHKLYHAGKVLLDIPDLSYVGDLEKLSTIAKIPVESLQRNVERIGNSVMCNGVDITKSSRAKLTDSLKAIYPNSFKTTTRLKSVSPSPTASPHVQSDLESLIEAIAKVIESRSLPSEIIDQLAELQSQLLLVRLV